ncbi:hypothetical protein J2853_005565 [Streptosporangium lutulentum]|uniref:Uncharacterized protein n=1 Tax=Streptosporangium lutulentum TaxID=1461250 RepID=A0ABT9QK94_9ACTN|nr:hypothetical protein [Streptosporangium lutulentum]
MRDLERQSAGNPCGECGRPGTETVGATNEER